MIIIFLFLLGLAIGSFLNVLVYRTIHGTSPWKGRSKCPQCKKTIQWYDNIPLLSFILLRGTCRYCSFSIPFHYPVIEFLTGFLFIWWYMAGSFFFQLTQEPFVYVQPFFWLIVGILLLIVFFTDFLYSIIPDYTIIFLTILSLIYRVALVVSGIMQVQDFWMTLFASVGVVVFFFLLWFFTQGKGMGFGDVKFVFPIGLLLGWPNIVVGIFLSFLLGASVGVVFLVIKNKQFGKGVQIPFGPFLVLGTILALLWGKNMVQWYIGLMNM